MSATRQFTILVVDDEPLVLETAAELLQTRGHRVLVAASGAAALAMVQTVRPDLMLVDHYMPEMSGLELVRLLKAAPATQSIAIVALTAAISEVANELSRAGCIGFIPKPIDPTEFGQLIADILSATVGRTRQPS